MLCPTTSRAGSVGGFVGEFCWITPRGGRGLVVVNLYANTHVYIPCGHSEWTSSSRTRYLLANFVWQLKQSCQLPWWHFFMWQRQRLVTFFSRIASSISWGLFILNPPSGWGFDKPEMQIPTLPPIYMSRTGGSGA